MNEKIKNIFIKACFAFFSCNIYFQQYILHHTQCQCALIDCFQKGDTVDRMNQTAIAHHKLHLVFLQCADEMYIEIVFIQPVILFEKTLDTVFTDFVYTF